MNVIARSISTSALLLASLSAQRVWVVDSLNRPGADFTDLPAAVAAVAAGDMLVCRPGAYSGFATAKGVTIVGNSSTIGGEVVVRGLPANERFAMSGLEFNRGQEARLTLDNNAGLLIFEEVGAVEPGPMGMGRAVHATHCAHLSMTDCYGFGSPAAVTMFRTRAVLTRCQFGVSRLGLGTGAALDMDVSDVEVLEPRFDAGRVVVDAAPAIRIRSGRLNVISTAAGYLQGGGVVGTPAAAAIDFVGPGSAYVSARLRLNPTVPGPSSSGAGSPLTGWPAGTSTTPLVAGQTATVTTLGIPGWPAALVFGLPIAPVSSLFGVLLFDPNGPYLSVPLSFDPAGQAAIAVPVPSSLPAGTMLTMQAWVPTNVGAAAVVVSR